MIQFALFLLKGAQKVDAADLKPCKLIISGVIERFVVARDITALMTCSAFDRLTGTIGAVCL